MKLVKDTLEELDIPVQKIEPKRNQLTVTYERTWKHRKQMAPAGSIWYHADIEHYDGRGKKTTGKTTFQVSLVAEKQKGEEAVKQELNDIVAVKMKRVLDFKNLNS